VLWRLARLAHDGSDVASPFWASFVRALAGQPAASDEAPQLLSIDWGKREVLIAGAPVRFAPSGAAARDALGVGRRAHRGALAEAAALMHVDADIRARIERSLTARIFLCTATGGLRGDDFKAAVRMLTHTPEPEVYGKLGAECPLCQRGMFAAHHRTCGGGHQAALTATHHAVRDVVCDYINGTAGVHAAPEVGVTPILRADGTLHHVRADLRVCGWELGPVVVEIKTYDPRCASWRNKTPAEAERELGKRGAAQYAPGTTVRVLVLGADGTVGARARALLMELIALREDRGALLPRDHVPDLCCGLVEAMARCESKSYKRWADLMAHRVAADCAAAATRAATCGGCPAED